MSADEVRFEVARTKADYFWAIMFNALRQRSTWSTYALLASAVAAIAFVVSREAVAIRLALATGVFVLMFAVQSVLLFACLAFVAVRNWQAPGAFSPIAFALSPAGLGVTHETGHGETKWSVWKSFFETRALIVITHRLGLVQIIPKRSLDEETRARVRAVLGAVVGVREAEHAS